MNKISIIFTTLFLGIMVDLSLDAAPHQNSPLTPVRKTTKRAGYVIDTVGDTLNQASPQNTRLIIRISGADKKLVKPDEIALVDKSGTATKPVFREDRKVGHEENTGLPVAVGGYADTGGYHPTGVGVDLNKILGPHGDYAYTKVDWPKSAFTADKRLQVVMPGGQTIVLPLTSLAR